VPDNDFLTQLAAFVLTLRQRRLQQNQSSASVAGFVVQVSLAQSQGIIDLPCDFWQIDDRIAEMAQLAKINGFCLKMAETNVSVILDLRDYDKMLKNLVQILQTVKPNYPEALLIFMPPCWSPPTT